MIKYVDELNQETVEQRFEKNYYNPKFVDRRGKSHWTGQATVEAEKLIDKWGREVFVVHRSHENLIRGDYNPALEKTGITGLVIVLLSAVGGAVILQIVGFLITLLASSSRRYHNDVSVMPIFLIIGLVAIGLTLIYCWLVGYPAIRRYNRLLEHGQLLQARTFFIANKYVKDYGYGKTGLYTLERYIVVDYEFVTPEGETIQAQDRVRRNDLSEEIPDLTMPVVVLYENNKNYMVL